MEKYQFAFHSEIIGYTSPYIGEVRKAIHRKVEKEKSAAIKNDIELHMYKVHDGIPVLLNTCWKSHATLTLLAKQDLPTFGYNMIAPLKSWCWGSILFYPFKISRFS